MNPENGWKGFREFVLVKKVDECEDIKSFYFKPKDGGKVKPHIAGQFIAFKVQTEDPKYKNVIRAYSISSEPSDEEYRVSIKKVEGGVLSSYLCDELKVGDIVESLQPNGKFTTKDLPEDEPIILLSGGIGVTPVLSMLKVEHKQRKNIHIVQAVQNSNVHPFKEEIEEIATEKNLKNTVFFSNPLDTDKEGQDYDVKGFVTKEWLKDNVPLNGTFYFCGPEIFMETLKANLLALNVSEEKINFETF